MNSVFCIYLAMILIPGVGISKYTYITWWRHQMEKNPRYWPFVRGIHRSPVNSPHKGQWRGALMFYLICAWINGWVNNREPGDLRRYRAHYDVTIPITTHMHVVNTFGSKQNCHHLTGDILNFSFVDIHCIWVGSWRFVCLQVVTWFCYQLIANPGKKTVAPPWRDPFWFDSHLNLFHHHHAPNSFRPHNGFVYWYPLLHIN